MKLEQKLMGKMGHLWCTGQKWLFEQQGSGLHTNCNGIMGSARVWASIALYYVNLSRRFKREKERGSRLRGNKGRFPQICKKKLLSSFLFIHPILVFTFIHPILVFTGEGRGGRQPLDSKHLTVNNNLLSLPVQKKTVYWGERRQSGFGQHGTLGPVRNDNQSHSARESFSCACCLCNNWKRKAIAK